MLNVIVPIAFFVLSFFISFLCYRFVLNRPMAPESPGTEEIKNDAAREVPENAEQTADKQEEKKKKPAFKEKIKYVLFEAKHCDLYVPAVFALISAAAGIFALYRVLDPETPQYGEITVKLLRLALTYGFTSIFFLTDIKYFIIPNKILILFACLRLPLVAVEYFIFADHFWDVEKDCLIAAAGAFVLLAIISLVSRGGIGMGDVKLFTLIAAYMGIYGTLNVLLYGLVSSALVSLAILLSRKKKAKDKIPFAPFIFIGFVITICIGSF